MKEKELGLNFWAAVAVSAIGMGVVIAFVAGFLLGHFTGHHTTTGQTQETTTGESSEGEKVTAANGIALVPAFSSFDEINTENIKELKGDWMTKIGANATAAKFSAEGQALEYEGTIYISDGTDDVFTINASTGSRLDL